MNQNNCHQLEIATETHPSTERNESCPEITPYAMKFIRCKAQQLVGKGGIQRCERDDIEQELYIDLWQRLDKFDSDKAMYNTFVQRVVENKIANLLRERCSDKGMAELATSSLSLLIEEDPLTGEMVTLGDSITNEHYDAFVRNKTRSREEDQDLTMDMQELLSKLPEYARRPCELLMEGRTIDETAQLVGMKRITFYRQILEPLREVFQGTNLKSFP